MGVFIAYFRLRMSSIQGGGMTGRVGFRSLSEGKNVIAFFVAVIACVHACLCI